MSQDQDDTHILTDEEEISGTSSSSIDDLESIEFFRMSIANLANTSDSDAVPGSSREITDEDSSTSKSAVKDTRVGVEDEFTSELYNRDYERYSNLSWSIDSQGSQKDFNDSLPIKSTEPAGIHKEVKTPETPSKRLFPFSDEDSELNPDFKKRITSTSPKQKDGVHKRVVSIESKFPFIPVIITPDAFEKEFTRTAGEENNENLQHSSQRSQLYSQNPITQSTSKHMDASKSALNLAKHVGIQQETKNSDTPTQPRCRLSDDNSESQPDFTKLITSTKPDEKKDRDTRITTTELNLPTSHVIFSPEKFQQEFAKISGEDKNILQHSSQQSEHFLRNPISYSPPRQIDDPNFALAAAKQVDTHQEAKVSSTSTDQQYRLSGENSESQTDSEKHITSTQSDEKTERSTRITTIDLNLPFTRAIFSPEIFEKEFARTSSENIENPPPSSQQSELFSQNFTSQSHQQQLDDPSFAVDSVRQVDPHQEARIPTTPKKRRHSSSEEKSESQPDSKKHITSTKPVAIVKGHARTSSIESNLPSSNLIFSPARFEKEFARISGTENEESTQPSSQRFSFQNPELSLHEQETKNYLLNAMLWSLGVKSSSFGNIMSTEISELENPGEGPTYPRSGGGPFYPESESDYSTANDNISIESPTASDERSVESPTAFDEGVLDFPIATGERSSEYPSDAGEIHFFEIPSLVDRRNLENLNSRAFLIASRLSVLENRLRSFTNRLNSITLQPVSPPCDITRSHSFTERRKAAIAYHKETMKERWRFQSREPLLEIFRQFETGMTEILNDIRYGLSICCLSSSIIERIRRFKERVIWLFTQFRKRYISECRKRLDKHRDEFLKIFSKFFADVEALFKDL